MTLASQMELARLVDLAAHRLNIQIEYDPQALRGTVTVRNSSNLDNAAIWRLTNDLLASRGFTTIRPPGTELFSVVAMSNAKALARVEPEAAASDAVDTTIAPGFVTRTVRLQHMKVRDATDTIKQLLGESGSVVPLGDSGVLLVSDRSTRVDQALAVVQPMDTPSVGLTIEVVNPVHVSPDVLAATVMEFARKRTAATPGAAPMTGEVVVSPGADGIAIICPASALEDWKSLIAFADRPQRITTALYSPRRFGLDEVTSLVTASIDSKVHAPGSVSVVRDDLTGTLIITASPEVHAEISALIDRLEATADDGVRPLRTFPIRNRPVDEVLDTLNSLAAAGAIDAALEWTPQASPGSSLGEQPSVAPFGIDSPSATSVPQSRVPVPGSTFSASANGNRPQAVPVASGTLSLTVDLHTNTLIAVGEARQLAQLERILKTLDVRQPQVMVEVLLVSLSQSDTLNLGIELDKLDSVGDATVRLASLFGLNASANQAAAAIGGTAAVFSPGEFSILVRALQNLNQGRSVSVPRVLVNNNQAASFASTIQQPFATSNATNSSTTITFGGSQSAGTSISITPQLTEGDHLVLKYNVSLSAFVGSPSSSGLPPPRQENRVDSVATIPDGFTVAVGGLTLTSNSGATTQVPLLGEVPILGELFKSRDNSTSESRFYVFIRANVMRQDAMLDFKFLSLDESFDAGIPQDWPTPEPQVIP